jgi:hypothetical protein
MLKFWTGGNKNYAKALRERYNADRRQLQARLRNCADPDERRALTEEMQKLDTDFNTRLRSIDRSLF